jgi:hypothetical protein
MVVLQNKRSQRIKVDAVFGALCALYRREHLPTPRHSTQSTNAYLIRDYIEPRWSSERIRDVSPIAVTLWIRDLRPLLRGRRPLRIRFSSLPSCKSTTARRASGAHYDPLCRNRCSSPLTARFDLPRESAGSHPRLPPPPPQFAPHRRSQRPPSELLLRTEYQTLGPKCGFARFAAETVFLQILTRGVEMPSSARSSRFVCMSPPNAAICEAAENVTRRVTHLVFRV